jgi:hypothetical protein
MPDDQLLECDDWVAQVCGVDPRSYSSAAGDGPNESKAPAPSGKARPVAGPPDDGSSAGSKLHPFWQAGYDEALGKPVKNRPGPAPFTLEASQAYNAGAAAAKAAKQTAEGPLVSTAEPEVCEAEPAADDGPDVCEAEPAPPQPAPAPKDDGEGLMSPLHAMWQEGYDAAFANPDEDHPAPIPYSEDAIRAYEAGAKKGKADAEPQAPPEPAPQPPGPSTTLSPSPTGPTEEPTYGPFAGAPAFRYNFPEVPIGSAQLLTPAGIIMLSLSLRGSVTVTFPDPPPGVSTDVNNQGWRVEAAKAVGPITSGIRVNGIGTGELSIGAMMGTQFAVMETRLTPPSTMSFIGQAKFDHTGPTKGFGKVSVKGQAGFELRVTLIPAVPVPEPEPQPEPEPEPEDGWWDKIMGAAALVGTGVVIVVAVVGAPETEGGSLLLLKAVR